MNSIIWFKICNYNEGNDNIIIEQERLIVFTPDQPNQLFAFPNGIDVLDDPIFQLESLLLPYNNDNNSILDQEHIQEAANINNNNNNVIITIITLLLLLQLQLILLMLIIITFNAMKIIIMIIMV